jgi:hypothetical protein
MEYSKIIAVTGLPGLYELVSSKNDGAIVRSLDDKSSRFVSSRIHNFSHLESIEIYTVRDNVNLVEIFQAMQKNNTPLPDVKDNAVVKKYFQAVYPDIDFERVYSSDMKKMVKWLEVLQKNNIEIKRTEVPEEEATPEVISAEEPVQETEKAAKPVKAAKKKAPVKEETTAKKAATPKKTAIAEAAPKKKAAKKKASE